MTLKATINNLMDRSWVQFPVTVVQRFGRDNGGLFAAGLAFFTLLSFAPLILTGVAVMAFFIHNPTEVADKVTQIVQGLFPSGGAQHEIKHLITERMNLNQQVHTLIKGRSIAGVIGFLTLIWTCIQIFINASSAMNAAFEVTEKRGWLALRGVALGLLVASGILVSFTLFLSAAPSVISRYTYFIPPSGIPVWMLTIVFEVIAILVNALLYVIIYRFLPSANVTWKAAAIGGLTASVFWEVLKKGLAAWLFKENKSLYGELADLILFVLWIYYSMMILLLGAEVAAAYQKTGSFARRIAHFGNEPQDREEHTRTTRKPRHGEVTRRRSKGMGAELG